MEDTFIRTVLDAWGIPDMTPDRQIIKIFENVRDIRFGSIGSRDPQDVYTHNKGTCSGKNFLLRELYKGIGLDTKDMICMQRWKDLTWFPDDVYGLVDLPDELRDQLARWEIIDFHNYVKVLIDNIWVIVDATIDRPLAKLGFYTTEHWDGVSDMPLCFVGSHKVWDCGDAGFEQKAALTGMLPQELQDARHRFLVTLTGWLDSLRETGKI